jgi:hypothetical protein
LVYETADVCYVSRCVGGEVVEVEAWSVDDGGERREFDLQVQVLERRQLALQSFLKLAA